MKIMYPYNLTDQKYGKYAYAFEDCNDAVEKAMAGHIVIYWDDPEDPDCTPVRQVGFLRGVSYNRKCSKYSILTQSGLILSYSHAIPIAEEHCPCVFVNDESGAAVGRLIGVQYDEDKGTHEFLIRRLPLDKYIYITLTADKLMFVDNAPMGVGTEG